MKKNSNSRGFDVAVYESLDLPDTRYCGVFLKGKGEDRYVLIDPIRYGKICGLSPGMKKVMDKRVGPFFKPAKKHAFDYNINFMCYELAEIRKQWEKTNKPMINRVLSEICGKNYIPGDDDLYQSGVLDPTEAAINAGMKTLYSHKMAEFERNTLYYSLYAQFFHQMASRIEALFVKVLTRNGYKKDTFNRNAIYVFKGYNQKSVRGFAGFGDYDKMYAIWNFIKHNSLSTFNALKELFPEVLRVNEYAQGEIACFYVNFDDSLIERILTGVEQFAKEYCRLVFKEEENEAQWNSDEYFLRAVDEENECAFNPLGLPAWI
ncbi:MAG: hypothetical protein LBC53_09245 [Spirochaetaceae bacterium]|jgi:hypothetical protein|nr:hypothetical protein [Spirochaetaceae bacterium]